MTSPGSFVQATYPPDTGMRIGIARAVGGGGIEVEVSGQVVNCGYLAGVLVTVGDPVAILRGQASWLCLGRVSTQPVNSVPVAVSTLQAGATNNTGTYSNIAGVTVIDKFGSALDSSLLVELAATFTSSLTTSGADFGVLINGTAYTVASLPPPLPLINAHVATAGFLVIGGLPAGSFTVQPQFRRSGGAGTVTVGATDLLSFVVREVPNP